jgi:hypothetical protein
MLSVGLFLSSLIVRSSVRRDTIGMVDGTGQGGFDIGSMGPGVGVGASGILIQDCSVHNTTTFGLNIFDKASTAAPVRVVSTRFTATASNKTVISPCPPEYKALHKCTNGTVTRLHPLGLTCGMNTKHPPAFPVGGTVRDFRQKFTLGMPLVPTPGDACSLEASS